MSNLHPSLGQTAEAPARSCYFVFPGDLNTPTGGYRYDREIIRGLQKHGWNVSLISLEGTYPVPSDADKKLALEVIEEIEPSALIIVDGLVLGASSDLAQNIADRSSLIALVHHPLFLESGIAPELAKVLRAAETQALTFAKHVIVTSPSTQKTLISQMDVPAEKISIVLPGIDRPTVSESAPTSNDTLATPKLLCVGSLVPRKGQLHLVEALGQLKHLDWHLDLIGETRFDPEYASQVRSQIKKHDLTERIRVHGGIPKAELTGFYQSADLFVLPTYYEGYGMAFAEAMSFGLPIIASGEGAVASTVPPTAGFHVGAGDPLALGKAIKTLLQNKELRSQLSTGALAAARALPDWNDSAKAFACTLEAHR
ncbi:MULTISPECIES: glycosyltransferase family 4 protein [unclassified Pseudovibrio]|uniref:glycosyltransferase family 4 protein n=1 Tax=unclassified Pseudovibrio TaxID=2627060 RepID=UPI0007AEC92F|nr:MULTISPECIES: glycosyltransferase family 4 protein [unclassified Pseudovibrio]KZL25206.1 D-inositol 3-phosphate glycosyltransferase [Pseudovibrio sp. WM33]KZL28544.1 D-inositol 3-phosphate glycosyltransferase [Pseudovibrio sp. Ad37]